VNAGNIVIVLQTGSSITHTTTKMHEGFLKLPFARQPYTISEAWTYSDAEFAIHGLRKHQAIDFALPYGTKIYAPTTGFVLSTYQNGYITQGTGVKALSGEAIHYGYGYYINFRDPKRDLFMIFAHLSSISRKIPFYTPKAKIIWWNLLWWNSWLNPGLGENIKAEILNDPSLFKKMKLVKAGDYLGTVWVSGLEQWEDLPLEVKKAPAIPAKKAPKSRDESHLHMEIFQKSLLSGKVLIDPYGLYSGDLSLYSGNQAMGLWMSDKEGKIRFIKN
jgi:hypothetical protein